MPTLATLSAAGYAVLVAVMFFLAYGHASLPRMLHGLAQPGYWLVFVVAALAAWGLSKRYAWAWWLAAIAGAFQLFRILSWYVQGPLGRLPGTLTLVAMVLLALLLVLLVQRPVRTACSR